MFIPSESLFIVDYLKYAHCVPPRLRRWLFFNEPQLRAWYQGPSWKLNDAAAAIDRVHRHEARRHGAVIWGQKTPRFVRHMALINGVFENTKWILVYRDPRAVAASMFESTRHTYSIELACRRWLRDNQPILRILRGDACDVDACLIKYEDLILNYEASMTRIFNHIGVQPISAAELARGVRWPETRGSRFRDNTMRDGLEPQPDLIDRWRKTLSAHDIDYIQRRCAQAMQCFGYEPLPHADRKPHATFMAQSPMAIKDLSILREYITKWPQYLTHTALRKTVMLFCNAIRSPGGNR
jgi:hypothetical protein